MPDLRQRPRFLEGQQVINACRSWDAPYKALLVQAFQAGCALRRTSGQHVRIDNDLGMTTTIANGGNRRGNRSLKKYQNDTAKLIEGQKMVDATATEVTGTDAGTPEITGTVITPSPGHPAGSPSEFECTLHDGAPLKYVTQEQLDEHQQANHWQCPKCHDWIPRKSGAGGHTSIKHAENKPWTHKANYKGGASNGAKPGTVSELLDRPRPSPDAVRKTLAEIGKQTRVAAANGQAAAAVLSGAVSPQRPHLPDPRKIQDEVRTDPKFIVERVRAALGDDPRLADLEADRDAWKKRAEDAEAQISMMKALADQMRQAAEL